ncbi:MAG: hypothetical protein HXX19_10625 [Rhodoferax sp.]|nr:hypothetical protein [Rhodoferax sp.]
MHGAVAPWPAPAMPAACQWRSTLRDRVSRLAPTEPFIGAIRAPRASPAISGAAPGSTRANRRFRPPYRLSASTRCWSSAPTSAYSASACSRSCSSRPITRPGRLPSRAASKAPIAILGGSGWSPKAVDSFVRFAERFELPVATSFRRAMLFPNGHKKYAGELGIGPNPKLKARIEGADLVLLVGGRMADSDCACAPTTHPAAITATDKTNPPTVRRAFINWLPISMVCCASYLSHSRCCCCSCWRSSAFSCGLSWRAGTGASATGSNKASRKTSRRFCRWACSICCASGSAATPGLRRRSSARAPRVSTSKERRTREERNDIRLQRLQRGGGLHCGGDGAPGNHPICNIVSTCHTGSAPGHEGRAKSALLQIWRPHGTNA